MCEKCLRICNAIGELVAQELSRVTIINANPDFDGPNQIIEASGQWTGLEIRTFEGDDVAECLEAAVAAKRDHDGK